MLSFLKLKKNNTMTLRTHARSLRTFGSLFFGVPIVQGAQNPDEAKQEEGIQDRCLRPGLDLPRNEKPELWPSERSGAAQHLRVVVVNVEK